MAMPDLAVIQFLLAVQSSIPTRTILGNEFFTIVFGPGALGTCPRADANMVRLMQGILRGQVLGKIV